MITRLERLLLVVPTASAQDGIAVDELARLLDCTPEQVREDVDLLAQVGVPPFNPDDLIEIELRDERVYVDLPQSFERPIRLNATEAVALTLAGRALAPEVPQVRSALGKLREAISDTQLSLYDALLERFACTAPEENAVIAETLDRAARERRVVEIQYFAASEGKARPRVVRPRQVLSVDGVSYLSAQNSKGEERTYRLDRIASVAEVDLEFAPLPDVDIEAMLRRLRDFSEHNEMPRALVRFAPEVVDAALDRYPSGERQSDGSLLVSLPYASEPWLHSQVLSWGGRAELLAPEQARRSLVETLERIRAAQD